MNKRAINEKMINTFNIRITKVTVKIRNKEHGVKLGFSRKNSINNAPNKKLVSVVHLRVSKSFPVKSKVV